MNLSGNNRDRAIKLEYLDLGVTLEVSNRYMNL